MKKHLKEIITLLLQLLMFYIFPLFAGPTDAMGMVFLILLSTLLLSFILGCISNQHIKFLYPFAVAVLFVPSVFIYYNSSALIHSVWYLIVSSAGLGVGSLIHALIQLLTRKRPTE